MTFWEKMGKNIFHLHKMEVSKFTKIKLLIAVHLLCVHFITQSSNTP